ncbi:hypothetical protein E2C01_061451 [Portunus trituberculatus]|uniref:Uncharacterized protein n=1 Tax=Portunus trituberculatus TaxID=210409 RepID=A0A5B7HEE5_PORTR|nr:hypothetical protein [Portunus trituberculatus]
MRCDSPTTSLQTTANHLPPLPATQPASHSAATQVFPHQRPT